MVKPWYAGKRPCRFNLGESVFFVFLILLTAFILLGSPIFEVRQITVSGNHVLPAQKIIDISGITTGTNTFKINLKEAAENLYTLPLIKEVRLVRQLPSRVIINVRERQPVALVPTGNGFIQVDRDGVCLQQSGVGGSLPVVTGIPLRSPAPGQVLRDNRIAVALGVISDLPPQLLKGLSEIHIDGQGQVVLYTLDGVECRFGIPVDISRKAFVLMQVLEQINKSGRPVEYVDLTVAPVVKYVQ